MEYTKGVWKQDGLSVKAWGRGVISISPTPEKGGVFECVANAQLIAAAPEMYEALKAWDDLRAMEPLDSGSDIEAILTDCSEITDKALLKAEGRTP